MNSTLLDQAAEHAFASLERAEGRIADLPIPAQTLVIVYSAQGIIDNGGLEYFYESNFHGDPEYSFFVDAYRRIGAESAAACLEASAAMFPFGQPHLREAERQNWLDAVRDDEEHLFVQLSRKISGDPIVFMKLAEYVAGNSDAFRPA